MKSLLILIFLVLIPIIAVAEKADLILKNGTIITMQQALPEATALAIRGDRIVWIGETREADKWDAARVIDLKGAYAYPGLIDSHAHILSLGSSRLQIDLNDIDKATILNRVRDRAANASPGEWIMGRGWDQNLWTDKKFPTSADLDSVAPKNPVFLERTDGHAAWVNGAALELAGISSQTKDPAGGKIIRDAEGNPTGVLVDTAVDLVAAKMKSLTLEEEIQRTNVALQEALQKGITMIHDAGSSEADLQAWKKMASTGDLPVRIYSMVWLPGEFGEKFLRAGPAAADPYLDIRSIKLVFDGAMGSRGAALLEPYSDDPGNTGLLMWKDEDLMRVLQAAKAKGIQVGIHAIGDKANRLILNAYEKVGVKNLRWRIEHVQMLAPSDIPRLAELDVIASMQPCHATADMPWVPDRVGSERAKGTYAWRSLLNQKTRIAGGSDAPVEDINPLWGIYSAITRQDHEGKPPGGWFPEQRITAAEALKMFTLNAAYTAFREKDLGSLEVGKLGDIVVLPENLLTCNPKDLLTMKVLYTIVGGKIRYQQSH